MWAFLDFNKWRHFLRDKDQVNVCFYCLRHIYFISIHHLYSFVTPTMTSTVLFLAVWRIPVTYELSQMILFSVSSYSSVNRVPAWCSEAHVFDSCQGLRLFLCPMLVSCWSVHFSHFVTELKIHHLCSFIVLHFKWYFDFNYILISCLFGANI